MTLTAKPDTIQQFDPKDLKFNEKLFQKMPQLTDEARELLLADIAARGVTVPIEITTDGVVVDGHNRVRLALEAGVDTIPAIVKEFGSDEEATAHVFSVNLQRRHLNQADKRKLIKEFLALDPYKSNRQVADELGGTVTDKTVGAVRDEAEKAGEITKSKARTGKDGKTRSTSKPKASKGASERRKIEQERNAVSSIRLGVDEAARLAQKVEGFSVETILGVLANATKAKAKLAESLTVMLPIYLALAVELGVEVEGYEFTDVETDEASNGEADAPAEQDAAKDGDAPF